MTDERDRIFRQMSDPERVLWASLFGDWPPCTTDTDAARLGQQRGEEHRRVFHDICDERVRQRRREVRAA